MTNAILVALRHDNISPGCIHVTATEINYLDEATGKRTYTVQDMPKTESGERCILLPDQANKTLQAIMEINPSGEFLFMRGGRRIHSKSLNYFLKKACREVGIPERSTHKIRKTYASTLISKNVNEKLIQRQMGHRSIETTRKYYYFNTRTMDSDRKIISDAVSF